MKEVAYSRRYKKPLTLFMIDIDHFKNLNDTYGHQAGDHVLRRVSEVLAAGLREYDIVARYGGEEFSIILPATGKDTGATIAERLRASVEKQKYRHKDKSIPVTISLGVASYPEDGDSPEGLISAADKALYAAKESGRNQVHIW